MVYEKTLPIFFGFNNNYIIPALVAINSLLTNSSKTCFYKLNIVYAKNALSEENKNIVLKLINKFKNSDVVFIELEEDFFKTEMAHGNFNTKAHIGVETLYRIHPKVLLNEDYDRILWCDVDTVINGDISELADIDFEGNYIAAVKESILNIHPVFMYNTYKVNNKLLNNYFNGGVLLLNLKLIRESNIIEEIYKIVNNKNIFKFFLDQDVLNLAFYGKVKFLPISYNFFATAYNLNYFELEVSGYLNQYAKHAPWHQETTKFDVSNSLDIVRNFNLNNEINHLRDNFHEVKIFHFIGPKPWSNLTINYFHIFKNQIDKLKYLPIVKQFINNSRAVETKELHILHIPLKKTITTHPWSDKVKIELLFFKIPIIKIIKNNYKNKVYLFKIVPLMSIKNKYKSNIFKIKFLGITLLKFRKK